MTSPWKCTPGSSKQSGFVGDSPVSFLSLLGEKLVMMYKWDAGRALKLIEDEKVQAIVGVPTNTYDLAPWMAPLNQPSTM